MYLSAILQKCINLFMYVFVCFFLRVFFRVRQKLGLQISCTGVGLHSSIQGLQNTFTLREKAAIR